jgi:hypothetical protein
LRIRFFLIFSVWLFINLPAFCQNEKSNDSLSLIQNTIKQPRDTVKIGVYIISLHNFNYHEKEFSMRFWLWALYKNPEFDFKTQIEVPNAKNVEKSDIIIDTVNNMLWVQMKMQCIMKQNWSVHNFPFDDQVLKFHAENTIFDSDNLVFVADTASSRFSPTMEIEGWKITDFKVLSGFTEYNTAFGDPNAKEQYSRYSNFEVLIKIERNAIGLFLKLFIGMFIAFLISSVSFFINPEKVDARFGLSVGGLFAAVGNKYIIDSLLPETSRFTLVDTLHAITFIAIFLTIVISAICLGIHNRGKQEKANKINRLMSKLMIAAYVLINLLYIEIAIHH